LLQRPDIDINRGWGAYLPPPLAAIINGHSNVAMQLLAFGQRLDVDTQTYQKESALSLAARQGDLRVVDSILLDCRTDRNSVDDRGRTALWWAAYAGKRAIVERLLADDRVRSDVADNEGTTALDAAAIQNHSDIVSLLRAHRWVRHQHSDGSRRALINPHQ
jgi:ankyrin repeat protein